MFIVAESEEEAIDIFKDLKKGEYKSINDYGDVYMVHFDKYA